jgi:GTP-binding protein Era
VKSGFIAIVGRPNAGKSTLLNRLLGAKVSIVTPKAQTTRERVLGILTEARGQVVFVDTPGIHRAREGGINEYMVSEAREAVESTAAVWYLVDPKSELEHELAVLEILKGCKAPVTILLNKSDLAAQRPAAEALEPRIVAAARELGIELAPARRISAQTGDGVAELLEEAWSHLPEGPMYYPDPEQLSDRPERFFVAEKIREQLYLQLGDELPYSCAVEIEQFQEEQSRIEATIHVERESQKGMVIGKGGLKIKAIGSGARQEIEAFLGKGVFLGLRVKVLKDWTKNAEALRRMGYALPAARGKRGRR